MSNKTFLWIIIAAIVLPIGFLMFNNSRTTGSVSALQNGHAGSIGSVAQGQQAPDFSLQTLDGQTISLASYRGEKPVVLDFWATWCPNCRRDMPVLNGLYEQYKDEIEVIGVNLQESPNAVQQYIDKAGISFPIAMDPFGQASRIYGVQYTNTHALIDKDGLLVRVIPGDIRESDIKLLLGEI